MSPEVNKECQSQKKEIEDSTRLTTAGKLENNVTE